MRHETSNCPECDTAVNRPHLSGCDVERCSACGAQRLSCECPDDSDHDPLLSVWEGEWPGAAVCRELGWWAIDTKEGWQPCRQETPGATEDLNRFAMLDAYLRQFPIHNTPPSNTKSYTVAGGKIVRNCQQPGDHEEVMGCWGFYPEENEAA